MENGHSQIRELLAAGEENFFSMAKEGGVPKE
jgi:hypothetical protein